MKINLVVKTTNKSILKEFYTNLQTYLLKNLDLTLINTNFLPITIKKFAVLRSPHVNKNSFEHFEIRLYKLNLNFICSSTFKFKHFLKLIHIEGLNIKLNKIKFSKNNIENIKKTKNYLNKF